MLSCLYKGKPFANNQDGYTRDEKYELARNREFICPCCKMPVYYCHDGLNVAHFVHYDVGECPEAKLRTYDYSNTDKHEKLTEVFIDWIKTQLPDAEVYPDFLINNEIKTDIFIQISDSNIAIELQFKNISNPNFIERRELFRKNGVKDIWFFIVDEEDYAVGRPYHRTYYQENKREVYFYYPQKSICKIYKGLPKEQWERVGNHTLSQFVTVDVPLEEIKISFSGRLHVSKLNSIYMNKLLEKRTVNRLQRQRRRAVRERLKINLQTQNVEVEISSSHNSAINIEANLKIEQSKTSKQKINIKQFKQEKPITKEYKEYHFDKGSSKDKIFCITIIEKGIDKYQEYRILSIQVEKKEIFMTCTIENEDENIRYNIFINPFLDSMKKIKIQRYII